MQAKELARHVVVAVEEDLPELATHLLSRSKSELQAADVFGAVQLEDDSALLSELEASAGPLAYLEQDLVWEQPLALELVQETGWDLSAAPWVWAPWEPEYAALSAQRDSPASLSRSSPGRELPKIFCHKQLPRP